MDALKVNGLYGTFKYFFEDINLEFKSLGLEFEIPSLAERLYILIDLPPIVRIVLSYFLQDLIGILLLTQLLL